MTDTAPAETAPARVRTKFRIDLAEDALDWAIQGTDEDDYRGPDGNIVINRLAKAANLFRQNLSPIAKTGRSADASTIAAIASFGAERNGCTPEEALARICRIVKVEIYELDVTEAVAA